jgi:hypothetical protein
LTSLIAETIDHFSSVGGLQFGRPFRVINSRLVRWKPDCYPLYRVAPYREKIRGHTSVSAQMWARSKNYGDGAVQKGDRQDAEMISNPSLPFIFGILAGFLSYIGISKLNPIARSKGKFLINRVIKI